MKSRLPLRLRQSLLGFLTLAFLTSCAAFDDGQDRAALSRRTAQWTAIATMVCACSVVKAPAK